MGPVVEDSVKSLPQSRPDIVLRSRRSIFLLALALFFLCTTNLLPRNHGHSQVATSHESIEHSEPCYQGLALSYQSCLENHFNVSQIKNTTNIPARDFLQRQNALAQALHETSVDAFIVEPGYTFFYYANLSQKDWEPWEPEERPFLMAIIPEIMNDTISAKTILLAPSFEVQRVLLSNIPFTHGNEVISWEEQENPFTVLADCLSKSSLQKPANGMVAVVDEEMRYFIARGISDTGIKVQGPNLPISLVRETKSSAEIEILRAANTATVAGLGAVQKCLIPGLTEQNIETGLNSLFARHGLTPFFNLVMMEENAANPHGGTKGERKLRRDDFVLIDVGVHLHGYSSDISRTMLMDEARTCSASNDGCEDRNETLFAEKLHVWDTVLSAQKAAIEEMKPGNTAASVDLAARKIIDDAGYSGKFSHRLGHGIGIKAHESPYLNKGNFGRTLEKGMCFTSEPGVYIEGEFGVRHEDVILVTEIGPELLTNGLAESPWRV